MVRLGEGMIRSVYDGVGMEERKKGKCDVLNTHLNAIKLIMGTPSAFSWYEVCNSLYLPS